MSGADDDKMRWQTYYLDSIIGTMPKFPAGGLDARDVELARVYLTNARSHMRAVLARHDRESVE